MHARTSPPAAEPVQQLWGAFGDLFGADAVQRKYGLQPPEAWRETVNGLPAIELQRAMRRLVHSGRAHLPTLPEFVKLAKQIGDDGEGLKPHQPLSLEGPQLDAWARMGNTHLMGYVTRNYRRFAGPAPARIALTELLVQAKNRWVETMRLTDPEDREDGGKAIWDSLIRQAEADFERHQNGHLS